MWWMEWCKFSFNPKGTLRAADDEKTIIMNGFIWDNLPLVEKSIDAIDFSRLKQGVKINKFPGFFDLNRKDLLWVNFSRMQQKYGRREFYFHPDTYRLPAENADLVKRQVYRCRWDDSKRWVFKSSRKCFFLEWIGKSSVNFTSSRCQTVFVVLAQWCSTILKMWVGYWRLIYFALIF